MTDFSECQSGSQRETLHLVRASKVQEDDGLTCSGRFPIHDSLTLLSTALCLSLPRPDPSPDSATPIPPHRAQRGAAEIPLYPAVCEQKKNGKCFRSHMLIAITNVRLGRREGAITPSDHFVSVFQCFSMHRIHIWHALPPLLSSPFHLVVPLSLSFDGCRNIFEVSFTASQVDIQMVSSFRHTAVISENWSRTR